MLYLRLHKFLVFIRLSNYLEPTDHNNTLEKIARIPEAGLPSSSGWLLIAVLITHNHPTKPSSTKLSRQSDLPNCLDKAT
jgi:hypothetical protein